MGAVAGGTGSPTPSVYWLSSPTLANETLMVAGAGLAGATALLCTDPLCASPLSGTSFEAVTWEQSLQLVLPLLLPPPVYLRITGPAAVASVTDNGRLNHSRSTSIIKATKSSGNGFFAAVTAAAAAALTIPVNAPDVWWVQNGLPGSMRNGSAQVDAAHPSWINTTITAGEPLRVFGRSLAWDLGNKHCLSAAGAPGAVVSTKLFIAGTFIASASTANCYEATFQTTQGLPVGVHIAFVSTAWGEAHFGLTVLPPPSAPALPPVMLNVQAEFAGDLLKALAHAAAVPAAQHKTVVLGTASYYLRTGIMVPPNTTVVGTGATGTSLSFSVQVGTKSCSALAPVDFYRTDCDHSKDHCFSDIGEFDNVTNSTQDCCNRCSARAGCNGYTHEYDKVRGYLCLLKACTAPTGAWAYDCLTTAQPNGSATVSAYVGGGNGSDAVSGITVASDVV